MTPQAVETLSAVYKPKSASKESDSWSSASTCSINCASSQLPQQSRIDRPVGGVSMAAIWGELDKGPHATFTKFDPGYDAGMHMHTSDVWIVVVKGAYLYKDEAGERRVGPGDFLRVAGGHRHWSGGDKTEGAFFYEEASGKSDSTAAK